MAYVRPLRFACRGCALLDFDTAAVAVNFALRPPLQHRPAGRAVAHLLRLNGYFALNRVILDNFELHPKVVFRRENEKGGVSSCDLYTKVSRRLEKNGTHARFYGSWFELSIGPESRQAAGSAGGDRDGPG